MVGVPGSITASFMSAGSGRRSLVDPDLHLVDLADQQRVGAGPGVPRLGAVRVGAVVVVVRRASIQSDQVSPVRVRTWTRDLVARARWRRASQVTPTAPYPVTGSGRC